MSLVAMRLTQPFEDGGRAVENFARTQELLGAAQAPHAETAEVRDREIVSARTISTFTQMV